MRRRDFVAGGLALPALWASACARGGGPAGPPGSEGADERFDAAAALLEEGMRELGVPGAALGVRKDGVTLVRAFGVTSVEDPQPVTPETLFPLASISKTVTATAVLRLVEEGRLALEAPVRTVLPGFRVRDEQASRDVTLRHLLTHAPGWEGQLTPEDRGLASLEAFAASMAELPQLSDPGSVWSYNNAAFALAGRVIEVVSGRDIHQALRSLVFEPLGLARAFTRIGDVVSYRFAQGHRPLPDGGAEVVRPFLLGSSVTAGGVAMNVAELMSYAAFHLDEQGTERSQALSLASRRAMREEVLRKAPTADAVGLGWQLRRVGGLLTASHGGTAGAGHRLLLELVPERGLAFAVLTNHAEGWRLVEAVERFVLRTWEGVALEPNQPIVHRGVNEDMTRHASPLAVQPAPEAYVGSYTRAPLAGVQVRAEGGALVVAGAAGGAGTRLEFYGPDVAYAASGSAYVGQPYEFVRTPSGDVGWIRVNGRVARREA